MMHYCGRKRVFTKKRGSVEVVIVFPNDGTKEVTLKSIKKHQEVDQFLENSAYILRYPDGQVVSKLPSKEADFTVQGYSKYKGKPANQLTLYLARECPITYPRSTCMLNSLTVYCLIHCTNQTQSVIPQKLVYIIDLHICHVHVLHV